jgi:deoxyribonuclease (pyrimidine dimer)
MTRINSAIKVKLLTDEHLLAEHRELPRICSVYKKRIESNKGFYDVPKNFTLGTGHVLFFVNKGTFTLDRYIDIRDECIRRGFQVEDYRKNWLVYNVFNDYTPTDTEHQLLVERITERLKNTKKPYWHYYGKQISKEESINLIK